MRCARRRAEGGTGWVWFARGRSMRGILEGLGGSGGRGSGSPEVAVWSV